MANFNKVILMGNLTRAPEVKYLPSGMAVCDLQMAVNRRFKAADGEQKEEACFVSVTAWAKTAELCGEYLGKGSPLLVDGRLKYDAWEKDGQKHNRLTVVAENVQFLGGPQRGAVARDGGEPVGNGGSKPAGGTPSAPSAGAADDDNLPF